ncbi:MAG: hypothetical protein QW756_01395 [Nitrososphaerota archaeon]
MKVLPIAVVISLVLGFALGYIIIQYVQQPQIENLQTQLQAKENEIGALNAQISQLRNEVSRLSADITSEKSTSANLQENLNQYRELLAGLENRVSSLTSSNEEAMAQAAGAARRLEQAKASLELLKNDRVLLSWLNADRPGTRDGDREYWNETRSLAAKSEPSLAFSVDKILSNLDIYYNWQERFPNPAGNTREDLLNWCPLFIDWIFSQPAGVDQYNAAIDQFMEEVVLVIISHIDSLGKALEG